MFTEERTCCFESNLAFDFYTYSSSFIISIVASVEISLSWLLPTASVNVASTLESTALSIFVSIIVFIAFSFLFLIMGLIVNLRSLRNSAITDLSGLKCF